MTLEIKIHIQKYATLYYVLMQYNCNISQIFIKAIEIESKPF